MEEIESWQNGKWIPNSQIGASLFDSHYMLGNAVFDAFRTYKKIPHLLDDHLDRLYTNAKAVGTTVPFGKTRMKKIIYESMERNEKFFPNDEEYRFMIYVSPGVFRIYNDMGKSETVVTVNLTTCSRYAGHVAPYMVKGCTSLISSQMQIPPRFLDPEIKSCSRMHYWLADVEASRHHDGTWPILLDEYGFIAESSGANVGFVKDNSLYLPSSHSKLQGCTMKFVEKLANEKNINVVRGDWKVRDLLDADGIVFTGAFVGIVPSYQVIHRHEVFVLNGKRYYADKFAVTNKIIHGFGDLVGVDIEKQWRDWHQKALKEV